jgi:asparagine synthase (glutamine-hydrolysing)
MCGISGTWGRAEQTLVCEMMDRQAHRGPDGAGVHVEKHNGVLGHRRLSIMDPKGGRQPIYSEHSTAVIVANGEIYNHHDLRHNLESRHKFQSDSDSEVVLHLYEEKGPAMVQNLDGMFAFAVADGEDLFLARDPIGIKPLYYGIPNSESSDGTLYFASELKALADAADDVREFPPGTFYHSQQGFLPYYMVPADAPDDVPLDVRLRRLRQTLEEAVVKRLMSDVSLGAFLSGGLDSSIIAAIARQYMPQLHTFAVGVEGSPDVEAARMVAKHIGSTHHEYLYTPQEVMAKLQEIIYHLESFDQDLVRSAIPCYFCSRLASDYVKVILTGEGADELFAGYTYYKDIRDPNILHSELRRSVTSLHNVNLQRVDRLTMCHGIEGRVPFLDVAMIELAQTIPPELKLATNGAGRRVEKWILRKACEDLLPPEIVWRDKEQFDEGSGTVDLLPELIQSATQNIDFSAYAARYPDDRLRSREEALYHQLLVDAFSRPQQVLRNVGRWSQPRLNWTNPMGC